MRAFGGFVLILFKTQVFLYCGDLRTGGREGLPVSGRYLIWVSEWISNDLALDALLMSLI